jgi:hypothetical protein
MCNLLNVVISNEVPINRDEMRNRAECELTEGNLPKDRKIRELIFMIDDFMDNEITTWLYDVLQSIREIESYFDNKPKRYSDYLFDTN